MSVQVTSTAFGEGEMIPEQYTCDGVDISPPLSWDAASADVKTYALITDDPDAPGKTWVHWVLFNLPASIAELPENVPHQRMLANGAKQGINDSDKTGYSGPCPPSGTHRYYFKVYALDTEIDMEPGVTKAQLLDAMDGHILAEGSLMGRYSKK